MAEIVFAVPGRDKPGYLRRAILVSEIQEELRSQGKQAQAGTLRKMVDFLSGFCTTSDGGDPKEALLDCSQDEYEKMMGELGGTPVPNPSGADSSSPSPAPSSTPSLPGPDGSSTAPTST